MALADYVSKIQIGNGEEADIKDSRLDNIYTWFNTGSNSNLYIDGSAPASSQFGSILRLRGDGMPGVVGVQDTYWLGIDSNGNIYTGTQLNGVSAITWSRITAGAMPYTAGTGISIVNGVISLNLSNAATTSF